MDYGHKINLLVSKWKVTIGQCLHGDLNEMRKVVDGKGMQEIRNMRDCFGDGFGTTSTVTDKAALFPQLGQIRGTKQGAVSPPVGLFGPHALSMLGAEAEPIAAGY